MGQAGKRIRDNVEVIVPFWGDDPDREQALAFVLKHLQERSLPVSLVCGHAEERSKGAVLWPVIRHSEADIIVLHDADVVCWGLSSAIDAIVSEEFLWALPHWRVMRLTRDSTRGFIASGGESPPRRAESWEEPPYRGVVGGGIIVARAEVFLDVPVDPRFLGWGQEDQALGNAIWTLYGPPWIGDAELFHLWHEPAPRMDRKWGSEDNLALYKRYHKACSDPVMMLSIVAEAHQALSNTEVMV